MKSDAYWLTMTEMIALSSDCTRRAVGAVIVFQDDSVSDGFNHALPGEPKCLGCPRRTSTVPSGDMSYDTDGPGRCYALHAEVWAILHAERLLCVGATMFLNTEPCAGCWKLIRAAGITRVVWHEGEWKE